jgi:transposase
MEQWTEIRHKVLVDKVSKRQIRREYRIGAVALEKVLANPEPPGYRARERRYKPKLGPFTGVIDEILERDADPSTPRKQRHTARRIFQRLRDEHHYQGSEIQVRRYVALQRRHLAEVFVPLSHPPGRAQFDFGEATVEIAGERRKAALAVMALPYSDAVFISAYPRECTETFQQGHLAAFEFFDAVPTKCDYDNTSIAVSKVMGGSERELTREFLRPESHFLFTHRFCRVGRGNEKGVVEGLVGFGRRNFLVPVPSFGSFAELNEHLAARCLDDLHRRVRGKPETKAERLVVDRAAMLELPESQFEARRVEQRRANSLSLVRFDRNDYSVPTKFAHHDLTVIGAIEEVRVECATELVAIHRRHWGREQVIYNPVHYLALLERKPGALDVARPLSDWALPECFSVLRRRLESDLGHRGTREFIRVLRLMERCTLNQLAGAVIAAVEMGATTCDAIALILAHRMEEPASLFSLDGMPHLKPYAIDPPDLTKYRALTSASAQTA